MEATGVIRPMNEEREGHRQEDIVIVHEGITEIVSSGFEEDEGFDGFELLAAAEEGRTDKVLEVLEKDPNLMLIADLMGDTALHLAVRAGHDDTFLKLIDFTDQHSELKKVLMQGNQDGDTALHLAIKNGRLKAAEHFVDAQFQVSATAFKNAKNKDGVSASALAEQSGYTELYWMMFTVQPRMGLVDVEMALNSRALENYGDDDEEDDDEKDDEDEIDDDNNDDDNDCDDEDEEDEDEDEEAMEATKAKIYLMKWSKLRDAARKGQEDVVQQILEQDPELAQYVHDFEGTALHVAVRTGQVGTLRQLIQFIMTSSQLTKVMLETDTLRDTALHTALKNDHHKAAKYLIEAAPQAVYQVNDKGVSPLVIAVEKGHEDLLRCMIRQTSLSSSVKQSMLYHAKEISLPHTAIKANNLGTLQALMEALPGLINLSNGKGWKPLSYAASKGYLDQVIYLLKTFPESSKKRDKDGSFPIHKAVAGGHVDILKEFSVCCPETLCAIDKKGRSILHIAVRYLKGDVLAYLKKDSGIEKIFNIRDNAGNTFMDMEEKNN